ncbi:hypothetical protein GPL21_17160 [Bradyrhizobium pachyrhizi]|uniref:Uncharacterized protein n=1 Tax=Bradyrhizobium pachyrhizi TaxID=280333 RepID=A0A844SWR1_9BRAD|nr:hypothetical protein [Bradyrhizobium pachyrhizi]
MRKLRARRPDFLLGTPRVEYSLLTSPHSANIDCDSVVWECGGNLTRACCSCDSGPYGAFLSEVDTGSREENASKQGSRAPFRFHRNGKGSSVSEPDRNDSKIKVRKWPVSTTPIPRRQTRGPARSSTRTATPTSFA